VFKTGPGVQWANGQCLTCHSADYAAMQPPKGLDFWQAEVQKMKDKYGAPIPSEQTNDLANYFAVNYGTGVPAAAPVIAASGPSSGTIDAAALAQRSGCLGCHNVDVKIVGPAYKDVAAKYRGKPDAMDKVAHQITHAVPANGRGNDAAIPAIYAGRVKALGQWVLGQK